MLQLRHTGGDGDALPGRGGAESPCGPARLPAAERGCCLILPEPEPEPEPRCAAYWRSPIPGMLSPLYGKLALRILGGLAHFRRKPTELAIRTDAPAHRRLWLPSCYREFVHHATCSLRLQRTYCPLGADTTVGICPPLWVGQQLQRLARSANCRFKSAANG